ncbi:hypothetical protein Emag_007184 [Eimeria magna]
MPLDVPPRECTAAAAAAAAAAALELAVNAAANGKPRGLLPATLRCSRAGVQQLFCRVNCSDFVKTQRALIDHFVSQVLPAMSGAASSCRLVVIVESFLEVCSTCCSSSSISSSTCVAARRLEGAAGFLKGAAAAAAAAATLAAVAAAVQYLMLLLIGLSYGGHAECHPPARGSAAAAAAAAELVLRLVLLLLLLQATCRCWRYRLSGAQRIIFLGPPCSPEVYMHLLMESLPAAADTAAAAAAAAATGGARVEGTALCYFTRFQLHSLERLMPLRQALQLLQAPQGRVIALS